ncbi:MAG: DUF4124 domain-containing protein [Proteobacteria bacterium]|nr:DUF4124 domain-containing protein [Pseudomonadota bacterium]
MKNLNSIILNYMYRKSRVPILIVIIFLIAFSLICTQTIQAGEMYKYTDKDGNTVITNTPNPERYQVKVKEIYSYSEASSSEKMGLEKDDNSEVDDLVEKLINDPSSRVPSDKRFRKNVLKAIVTLREAQLRNQGNPQDEMETKMKRQQRDTEDILEEMESKKVQMEGQQARMNAEMIQQQAEISQLQHQQRMNTFFGK